MDDIVEELRTFAEVVDMSKGSAQLVMLSGDVFSTAADEIERLREVVQRQAMELLVAHSQALGLYDITTPTQKETRRG